MKYLILTSSIFYLLGLKMTHNIEINQKMDADTVQITIPAEKNMPKAENEKSLTIEPQSPKVKRQVDQTNSQHRNHHAPLIKLIKVGFCVAHTAA